MKKKEHKPVNGKLYFIEQYPPVASEDRELFTWKDACEVARHCQAQHTEETFLVREFEPI